MQIRPTAFTIGLIIHSFITLFFVYTEFGIGSIYLPPYSPNLNLIERLWKFLRSKILANKYYDSFKQFFDNVHDFLDSLHIVFSDSLDSLFSFNFQCLDSNCCLN